MISINIFLYLTIVAGSSLAGFIKYLNYIERVTLLEEYIVQLEKLRVEINYRNEHIPAICNRLSYYSFFGKVHEIYFHNRGISIYEAWQRAAEAIYTGTALKDEDIRIIVNSGSDLGKTGKHGQIKLIELSLINLRNQLEDAREEKRTKGKMVLSLGVISGITIVILLI